MCFYRQNGNMHAAEYTNLWKREGGILLFLYFGRRFIMNEVMEKEVVNIENMIYEVRGVQVLLDSDYPKVNVNL